MGTFLFFCDSVPAQKVIMKMLEYEIGGCHLPLVRLTQDQYETLENDLEKIGFWDTLQFSKSTFNPSSNAFTEA